MRFKEIQGNVLDAPIECIIAHCISGDMALGAGVAKQIESRFNVKPGLKRQAEWMMRDSLPVGQCFAVGRIFNLVTKERYFHKPTLVSLQCALEDLLLMCYDIRVTKVAMPMIGCGLDRLNWSDVSNLINEVFGDSDIEVFVYHL